MGIAGLWSSCKSPQGVLIHSFTMLTINASERPLMKLFHKPCDEKRMVVILQEQHYDDWLKAPATQSQIWLRPYRTQALRAVAAMAAAPSQTSMF